MKRNGERTFNLQFKRRTVNTIRDHKKIINERSNAITEVIHHSICLFRVRLKKSSQLINYTLNARVRISTSDGQGKCDFVSSTLCRVFRYFVDLDRAFVNPVPNYIGFVLLCLDGWRDTSDMCIFVFVTKRRSMISLIALYLKRIHVKMDMMHLVNQTYMIYLNLYVSRNEHSEYQSWGNTTIIELSIGWLLVDLNNW